jgi:hypothetical protein
LECILNQVDPQFEANQVFLYRLSILLCPDGFSFLVTHSVSKKVLKLSVYRLSDADYEHSVMGGWPVAGSDYLDVLTHAGFCHQPFKRIDIAVASYKVTVAPADFFEFGNKFNIMSAAHSVNENEIILTEPVFDLGPVTAALIPGYIRAFCDSQFPGSWLHNAPAVFVKGVLQKYSKLIIRQVFINIHRGYFEIAIIQGSLLLYLNSFRYSSASDVLYYIIFVLEQLGFVPSEEKVTLSGEFSESEIVLSQLKMYCGSINYSEKPDGIEFGEAFRNIDLHKYFTLINLPGCE